MANFDAQITDLVGGTIDQTACDQWMEDGVRELINVFPSNLKEMCYTKNTFTSAAAGSEAETIASQHLGNVFAGSYVCRRIGGIDKYKASDSGDVMYATSTDPAYYVEGGKLNILPASSSGVYYLIPDPSIDADAVSAISNFPNEAEHLVVLYAAARQLLQYQSTMSSSWNEDITTALTAINTAIDRINTYNWSDSDTFDTAASQLTRVKNALNNAENLINGNQPSSTTDAFGAQSNEDTEIVASALSIASTELSRASVHLNEWSTIAGVALQESSSFLAEAGARLQQDITKYQWYRDQYAKLSVEYQRGLSFLTGQGGGK